MQASCGARIGTVDVVMDQLVVLINGPAGIGKSTVARRVAARAANGACVAGDDLKGFVVTRDEPPTVALGLAYVGAAALADVYLAAGFERVVVDFVFEHPRHISRFTDALVTRTRGRADNALGIAGSGCATPRAAPQARAVSGQRRALVEGDRRAT